MTISNLQRLRETTGAGIMECKKALDESKGDFDGAMAIIHERGLAKMEKRADRDAGAGLIVSYVHNSRIGVLLDIRAETDFVVRSEPFQKLAHDLAMHISAMDPQDVAELIAQPYVRDESKTVSDIIADVIGKVGENIKVHAFSRLHV